MARLLTQKMNWSERVSFTEFFSAGRVENSSPFLTINSRKWANNLSLKTALVSAGFLLTAFVCSFFEALRPLSSLLQIFVYFLAGIPALILAIEEIRYMRINIDVLMVLAGFLAIFINSSMEGGLLLVLFSISSGMENFVTNKAKGALFELNKIAPTSARVLNAQGKLIEKSIKDIQVSEYIFVRGGEVIPLDGNIVEGTSSLNIAHLTGESIPMPIREGEEAPAGAINLEGSLKIQVTKTGSHSTISKIIQLIYEAHAARPKLQTWFDRFGQKYSIFVILSSFIFALFIPMVFSHVPYFGIEGSIYRSLAYLIAASPCALIIAVPIAYISAISSCAKDGMILKGGIILDSLSKINAIAFDKTGTLTSGELECMQIVTLDGKELSNKKEILAIAYALEEHAMHPVAKAIIDYAQFHEIAPASVSDCKAIPGLGIEGMASRNNQKYIVAIGNLDFISGKVTQDLQQKLAELKNNQGNLVTALLIDKDIYIFHFIDHLRVDAQKSLKDLKKDLGLKIYILSGDNEESVKRVVKNLTVDKYFGHLLPEDKLKLIEEYSREEGMAMVGDGVNDAPALARASIGISMGKLGSHMAIEVSDAVLIKNDLSLINKLIKKARKTLAIVKQNVFLASIIILGVSVPALLGFIPLWLAVVCHEGGTVLVGLNSLRLLKRG